MKRVRFEIVEDFDADMSDKEILESLCESILDMNIDINDVEIKEVEVND